MNIKVRTARLQCLALFRLDSASLPASVVETRFNTTFRNNVTVKRKFIVDPIR